jgi:hypothetical protein
MGGELSMDARREITRSLAKKYAAAAKKEKGLILDHVTATTGWSRANARRQLVAVAGAARAPAKLPRRRGRKYSYDALKVLERIWLLAGEPCGKYLAVVMADHLERLCRFGELGGDAPRLTGRVHAELISMSPATIDRYLKPLKDARYPKALSGTRPGSMLRSQIPVRWSGTPMEQRPGFLEIDTVAHCGASLQGEYLWTLTVTDVFLGWTAITTVRNRAHRNVLLGLQALLGAWPYPVTGLDFDNGGEFVNHQLVDWAREAGIALTRARPYKHNDNAHVEQRNGDWVRRHAFRYRYEDPEEQALLNQLWPLVAARKNHLLPTTKAVGWNETPSGRRRRRYDPPRTPYQRMLEEDVPGPETLLRLAAVHEALNPAQITRAINDIQSQLINRVRLHNSEQAPGFASKLPEASEPISRAY